MCSHRSKGGRETLKEQQWRETAGLCWCVNWVQTWGLALGRKDPQWLEEFLQSEGIFWSQVCGNTREMSQVWGNPAYLWTCSKLFFFFRQLNSVQLLLERSQATMPTGKLFIFNNFFFFYSNFTNVLVFLFTCKFERTVKTTQSHTVIRSLCRDEKQALENCKTVKCASKKSLARVQELFYSWLAVWPFVSMFFFLLVCVIVCLLLTAVCEASPEHSSPNSTAVWTMSPACFITPCHWMECLLSRTAS